MEYLAPKPSLGHEATPHSASIGPVFRTRHGWHSRSAANDSPDSMAGPLGFIVMPDPSKGSPGQRQCCSAPMARSTLRVSSCRCAHDVQMALPAYSVEKLPHSALTPNLAEQRSNSFTFHRRYWAERCRLRTIFYFLEICRCSKEFFNKIGP